MRNDYKALMHHHYLRSSLVFLPMLVGACVATEEELMEFDDIEESDTGDGTETGVDVDAASNSRSGVSESSEFVAPLSADETVGTRYCTQDNHCRTWSCYCGADNTCTVGMVGPLPPDPESYCALAPDRPCASSLDCQSGCGCIEGYCSPVGISPQNPTCYLPPPDIYENDDTWTAWSSYVGPQRHSFHEAGDKDWIAVYAGEAGMGRFETHSLANQADTRLKVFRYENGVKGELLGVSDDIGGPWYWPDSKSSRIDLYIPAGSTYLIKVVDRSPTSVYTDNLLFPEYTLELSYL